MLRNDHLKGTRNSTITLAGVPCRIHALPSTIHMTIMLPPVATSSITANISAHRSFCHQCKSNGLSWLTKMQSESASLRTSRRLDLFKASSIKSRNSLRFNRNSSVTLRSRICALQLYRCSRLVLFIFTKNRRADRDLGAIGAGNGVPDRSILFSRVTGFPRRDAQGTGQRPLWWSSGRLFLLRDTEEACALLIWIYCIRIGHPA